MLIRTQPVIPGSEITDEKLYVTNRAAIVDLTGTEPKDS